MAFIPTICVLFCSDLFACNVFECARQVTKFNTTTAVNCSDYRPFNLSALAAVDGNIELGSNISTLKIQQCSLENFVVGDADVLSERNITAFDVRNTNLSTFEPLQVLRDELQSLTIRDCSMDDEIAATLPILYEIKEIDFSYNSMTWLPAALRSCRLMAKLDVSHNQLMSLDMFELSTNIIEVSAEHNQIETVQFTRNQFALRVVKLAHNGIKDLDWMIESTFVKDCKTIDVSFNNINTIKPVNIEFFRQLEMLNASHNNITAIIDLDSVNNIKDGSVDISANPLHCDCDLAVIGKNILWRSQRLPTCNSPMLLANYTVIELADMVCLDTATKGGLTAESPRVSTVAVIAALGKCY